MEYFEGATDVCMSGGANGADLEWGNCAAKFGHKVIHWSFPGHPSKASEDDLVRLSDEQLELGVQAIKNAAVALGKSPPTQPHVTPLIHRNYYQVAWSTSCYAVTLLEPPNGRGGTQWATKMFEQLHPGNHNLWVFDMVKDAWFQFNGEGWDQIESPPKPKGFWAGIGSRALEKNGRDAIRKLMGCEDDIVRSDVSL